MDEQLDPTIVALAKAIKKNETGEGDTYNAPIGADKEVGAYRWTPDTWKGMSGAILGDPNAPLTKENQNKVAYSQIKSWKDRGFTPAQIASMWNAGEGKPNAYKENWVGTSPGGAHYDTPKYAMAVSNDYHRYLGQPTTPSIPTVEQQKSLMAKSGQPVSTSPDRATPTLAGSIIRGAIKPFAKVGTSIANIAQVATGNEATEPFSGDYLGRVAPVGEGFDVAHFFTPENITAVKDAAGTGTEIATDIAGGGEGAAGAKAIATGKGFAVPALAKVAKVAGEGALFGGIGGIGSELQDKESTAGSIAGAGALGTVGGLAVGSLFGLGGLVLNKAGKYIARSNFADKLIPETEQRLAAKSKMVNEAKATIANEIKKAIPLTPSQIAKEENLFRKTGDNAFTTLAHHGIIPGQPEDIARLQDISDQYSNAVRHAQREERGYFDIEQIRNNALAQVDRTVPSLTSRDIAYERINSEIDRAIKEAKDEAIEGTNGEKRVKSDIVERLRRAGNSWTPFNASDPEKVGKSAGYALSNAVRDQVEKEGTFPGYREANRQWGKILHAEEILQKVKDTGKPLRTLGGLSGKLTRRFLSGSVGLHSGGIGGLVLGELGSEYGARVLSDPQLRTYFERKLIERFGEKKATPEAILQLEKEIRNEVDKRSAMLQLPAPAEGSVPIEMGPRTPKPLTEGDLMANDFVQNRRILENTFETTKQLPAPAERLIVPNTQGTPNQPGVDYGTPEVGGMRQRLRERPTR